MMTWKMTMTQDSSSPLMEQLIYFHDHTLLILMMITITISYILSALLANKMNFRFLIENQFIEIIWTIMPIVVLIFIALPSLRILYLMDELINPLITVKSIGHQWYWSYEYSDFTNIEFDSYMNPSKDMDKFMFRLLDVDNRVILPYNTQIRLIVSSTDVIHSWTVPSLGIKMDATPGRLNQTSFSINRAGLFYGQCSEICGANHSFMPIVVESVSPSVFIKWTSLMSSL
uniref:Cytochrome c oxidase subunit 2 n=1 Tax=Scydmaeninae sp. 840218 TaxID=1213605 RepID=A0A0S2MP61_9COLE|nr:cytochrome c oxidase subunit 2 [Scydmaeninae sp. 840218]